jgi:hypothetical protein
LLQHGLGSEIWPQAAEQGWIGFEVCQTTLLGPTSWNYVQSRLEWRWFSGVFLGIENQALRLLSGGREKYQQEENRSAANAR